MTERNYNIVKKKIIIGILIVLVLVAGIIAAVYFIKNRGGVEIKCGANYKVNDNLVSYRQDDDDWKDDKIGNSSFTMGDSGCIITSISTAISQSKSPLTPGELNAVLTENNVFDDEGNLQWGMLEQIDGFHVKAYSDITSHNIDECLGNGRYPIIKVHRKTLTSYHHYILVIGTKNGDYVCMDPLEDNLTQLSDYGNKVYAIRCVWYE